MRQSREGGASPGKAQVALSRPVDVVRTYLELRTPEQLRRAEADDPRVRFVRRDAITTVHYRRLYNEVGARWHWLDRNAWTDEHLAAHLMRPEISVWECMVGDESAGFFELEKLSDGSVEISYFGLAPAFIGRGIGKVMLTRAADEAWALGASRVWLHTCTLDSPNALPNYKARGFEEFRQERYVALLPDET
jgi:GNAT superfamily N-acetyltransferase